MSLWKVAAILGSEATGFIGIFSQIHYDCLSILRLAVAN